MSGLPPVTGRTLAALSASSDPVWRVAQAIRAAGYPNLPVTPVMATPPTVTEGAFYSLGSAYITNANYVSIATGVLGGWPAPKYWPIYFNYSSTNYCAPPSACGLQAYPTMVSFVHDGQKFALQARYTDTFNILVDGQWAFSGPYSGPAGSSYDVMPYVIDFGSRKKRNIVVFINTAGLAGVYYGQYDSITPLDLSGKPNMAAITDSYGGLVGPFVSAGIFGAAAQKLGFGGFLSSTSGGTGYITNSAANKVAQFSAWGRLNSALSGGYFAPFNAFINAATSANLQYNTNWSGPSGVYKMTFPSGDSVQATFTNGSPTVTWSGAITEGVSANVYQIGTLGSGALVNFDNVITGATTGNLTANWPYASGTWDVAFADGQYRSATLTNGSKTVTWSGALTVVPTAVVSGILSSPDMIVFAGGTNDGTTGLQAGAAAEFAAARALNPSAIICATGNWLANLSNLATAQTKSASILAALQTISGPWVWVDNINGVWSNSSGKSGLIGNGAWQTGQGMNVSFTALLTAATSGTLTTAWSYTSGSYTIMFADGTTSTATLTQSSPSITWTGAQTQYPSAMANPIGGGAGTRVTFTALLSAATSGTLTGNWGGATGTYVLTFQDGQVRVVTLTNGSAAVSWTSRLSANPMASVYSSNGNQPLYGSGDGTHPLPSGADYLASMFADGVAAAVLAL